MSISLRDASRKLEMQAEHSAAQVHIGTARPFAGRYINTSALTPSARFNQRRKLMLKLKIKIGGWLRCTIALPSVLFIALLLKAFS